MASLLTSCLLRVVAIRPLRLTVPHSAPAAHEGCWLIKGGVNPTSVLGVRRVVDHRSFEKGCCTSDADLFRT